jgi:sugar phosphate isomerase/epimerase
MNNVLNDLAVQSWCLRGFKATEQVIAQVKKIGVTNIELCGVHCDFNNPAGFDEVLAKYTSVGIKILSIGVQTFSGDEVKEENWFKFAKLAGCRQISASFAVDKVPGAFRVAEKLGDKYDVNVAIHNHGGYDWLGSRTMLKHVFSQTSSRIGLCMDAAWCMQAGERPMQMAEQFVDRLYGVHLKDFVFDRSGKGHDVVVGEGNLPLRELLELVRTRAPEQCSAIIEYESDVENPAPALIKCVAAVKAVA